MDNKKGQAIETNMHEKAWWLFTLAGLFAFILSYRKVVPQQDSIKASFNCVLG